MTNQDNGGMSYTEGMNITREGAEVPEDKTDNELIAEFMGIDVRLLGKVLYCCDNDGYIDMVGGAYPYYPNTSWDQLMEVVDKIQDVEIVKNRVIRTCAEVTIYYKACKIEYFPDEESGDEHEEEFTCQIQGATKIEAVYKAVVEFIKWYKIESLKNKPI